MNISSLIQQISAISRSKDWRLSFVPFTIACVYLWFNLFQISFSFKTLLIFALSLATTMGFAAFGYFINELFDQEEDRKAGKLNKLSLLKTPYKVLLFFGICCLTFLPWLYLPSNSISHYYIALEILCFVAYSFPLLRLKENIFIAGILDASYAYLIPSLLSFHTFSLIGVPLEDGNGIDNIYPILFFVLLFFIGYRNIFLHQVNDVLNDINSGLKTLPQHLGITKSALFLKLLFRIELALLFGSSFFFNQMAYVNVVWTMGILIYLFKSRKEVLEVLFPDQFLLLMPTRHILDLLYQLWFPIIQLFLLLFVDWKWAVLLPVHALLLVNKDYLLEFWQNFKELFWHKSTKPFLSFLINHTLYLLFRLFGVNLIKENKSAVEFIKNKLGK